MLPFAFALPEQAQIVPAEVQADDVSFDPREQALEVKGNVRVDASPFHLRSEELRLKRSWRGLELEGKGRLAFCPCLGTPLTVSFSKAAVAPPGDLLLYDAALHVYRVPILWLPAFWLRAPSRVGVLPPDLAYRGTDGVYLGAGAHLPLRPGDARHALDLRAGAYFKGGMVLDARLRTAESSTRVRWDWLGEIGTTLDARGSLANRDGAAVGWDVDAIRGARGLASTTDLEPASRRWDRARAEASLRGDGWLFATSLRAVSVRGGGMSDFGAIGPVITARNSGSAGSAFTYDVGVDGGQLRGDGLRALSFARGETGAAAATTAGPVGIEVRARGAGDLVADGERTGVDGVAWARATAGLPVGRAYESSETNDPWLHKVEPRVGVGAAVARIDGLLGTSPGRGAAGLRGDAWIADLGLASALGRWGRRDGLELDAAVGAAGDLHDASGLARWRAVATARMFGLGAEGAHLVRGAFGGLFASTAALVRARVGPADGFHVVGVTAVRDGVDPVLARLAGDPSTEPASGFLAAQGWTAGGRVSVPWWSLVTTSAGADFDLDRRELVGARAGVEIRDRCRCLIVRTSAAHRVGRGGVDVWVTIDLAP